MCSAPQPAFDQDEWLHRETARTRAACVSLSLFNNVKEQDTVLRSPVPVSGGKFGRLVFKPLALPSVSGDARGRSPTSGARPSVMGFI